MYYNHLRACVGSYEQMLWGERSGVAGRRGETIGPARESKENTPFLFPEVDILKTQVPEGAILQE